MWGALAVGARGEGWTGAGLKVVSAEISEEQNEEGTGPRLRPEIPTFWRRTEDGGRGNQERQVATRRIFLMTFILGSVADLGSFRGRSRYNSPSHTQGNHRQPSGMFWAGQGQPQCVCSAPGFPRDRKGWRPQQGDSRHCDSCDAIPPSPDPSIPTQAWVGQVLEAGIKRGAQKPQMASSGSCLAMRSAHPPRPLEARDGNLLAGFLSSPPPKPQ